MESFYKKASIVLIFMIVFAGSAYFSYMALLPKPQTIQAPQSKVQSRMRNMYDVSVDVPIITENYVIGDTQAVSLKINYLHNELQLFVGDTYNAGKNLNAKIDELLNIIDEIKPKTTDSLTYDLEVTNVLLRRSISENETYFLVMAHHIIHDIDLFYFGNNNAKGTFYEVSKTMSGNNIYKDTR